MKDVGVERHYFDAAKEAVPFYDSHSETLLGGFDFKRLQLGDMVLRLLTQTAEFRNRASSYRGFLVGAGVNAVNGPYFGQMLGYNIKLDETDAVNIHAEEIVETKVVENNFRKISVLAVIGEPQGDKFSGRVGRTLPLCSQRCRPRLAVSPLIDRNTLLVMATPDFRNIDFTNMYGLIRAQDYDDESGIQTFNFSETPSVFRPMPEFGAVVDLLADEVNIDTSDWDSTVDMWLRLRWYDLYGNRNPQTEKYYSDPQFGAAKPRPELVAYLQRVGWFDRSLTSPADIVGD